MSLLIQQDQITSNLKNDSKTNATQRKHHILIPRKRNTRQIQNNQIKTFVISRLASTNQHQHKTLTNYRRQHENITNFRKLNYLHMIKIAFTGRTEKHTTAIIPS